MSRIKAALENGLIPSGKITENQKACGACMSINLSKAPFKLLENLCTRILERVSVDLAGPMEKKRKIGKPP